MSREGDGLHNSNLHANDLLLVTTCPNPRPNAVFTSPLSQSWKEEAQHYAESSSETNTDATCSSVGRKKFYCPTNPASSISSVNSLTVVRLGMFLTIHVSVVIEIGITDQGNWMHDFAGGDVIFIESLSSRLRVFGCCCFFCRGVTTKKHQKGSFLLSLCKRS